MCATTALLPARSFQTDEVARHETPGHLGNGHDHVHVLRVPLRWLHHLCRRIIIGDVEPQPCEIQLCVRIGHAIRTGSGKMQGHAVDKP